MNFNKFTQKSQEVVQNSQELAILHENPQLEEIHLHLALLQQENGLIPKLINYLGENVESIRKDVEKEIDKIPKQSGSGSSSLYSNRIYTKILLKSEEEAKKFGDTFVSVEHLYIALLKEKGIKSEKIFKKY